MSKSSFVRRSHFIIGKSEGMRSLARLVRGWEDNINMDLGDTMSVWNGFD
jgi:hypothetical protein